MAAFEVTPEVHGMVGTASQWIWWSEWITS